MNSINVNDFSLQHSLECGQVFRWKKEGEFYLGLVRNIPVRIKQENEKIIYTSFKDTIGKKELVHYFNLNQDYEGIVKGLNKDKFIGKAIENSYGLRIINQEPFECLISYLCSSASNIPKINKNLDLIAEKFGNRIIFLEKEYHTFPSPEELSRATEEELACCSVGFRKSYIAATVGMIKKEKIDLEKFREMEYNEAKKRLALFPGVGAKIADCVCLYSLGFSQAFPVDVWIERIMQKFYAKKGKEAGEFASAYFGDNAGLAQQFLYYFYRNSL